MKFVISHKGIKRELETPFALCISKEYLELLIDLLKAQCAGMPGSFGWIRIDTSHPDDGQPNTRPLQWTEAGNVNPPVH